ncbi:TraR/DksA C4-type zinc finger protein [Micromonospora sp. WMMD1102]|uniref:TraR/DksA family transcriptional regulator n=1 Tax=Micromonospora sp. WMMD1102 TaxID=3016105 RepID=UPI002414D427|nr:TraR/DksA C4-type zinc finger protein [Micromonospora sp. WMMD1102]MDG4787803.1 TraR/DksA C4-type zinc finger protein [Micromonospora sp. WMMD1102]
MTTVDSSRLRNLRHVLQEQLDQQTAELARLRAHRTSPEQIGLDPQTVTALISTTQRAVADNTEALRRVTDGTYGTCEKCQQDIPTERLEILPHAPYCMPCQQARNG